MRMSALGMALPAIVLAYVMAELAARAWIRTYGGFYVWPPGLRLRIEPDPAVLPRLERSIRFDVNSEGERGGEVPAVRRGLHRILVVGGSHPEGLLLDQDSTWPGALQRILSAPEHRQRLGGAAVHVGCVARSGLGTEALAVVLERILPRYSHLDTIIVLVGASDVLRWLEDGAPPTLPAPLSIPEIFRSHSEHRFGWDPRSSALSELTRRVRRRWLRPVTHQTNVGRWMSRARQMRAHARVVRTHTASPAPVLEHFDRSLRRVLGLARAHANRVVLVRQPWCDTTDPDVLAQAWNGGIGKAWKDEVTEFFAIDVLSRLMTALDKRAAAVANEIGVEQIEVMSVLTPTVDNYYDFFHMTPQGAAIVARTVAQTILAAHGTSRRDPVSPPLARAPRAIARLG